MNDTRGIPAAVEILLVAAIVVAAAFVAPSLDFDYSVPVSVVIAVIVITLLQRAKGETWKQLGLFRSVSAGSLAGWTVAIVGAAFISSFMIINPLSAAFDLPRPDFSRFDEMRGNPALLLVWLIPIAWGSAAFGEEMLLRGFLMNRLAAIMGNGQGAWVAAAVGQALLFGLGHAYQGITGVITTMSIGLIMGIAFLLNGRNLWPLILAHGIIDTFGLLAIYKGYI